jgi:single-stranded DNA-binding protein
MNQVIISGLVKGNDFQSVSNDGLLFKVATRSGRSGNNADPDVFNILAYGKAAEFVRLHAKSGLRIVAEGRLSSEKLGTNNYHTVITIHKVLSVGQSQTGNDFATATVSGTVRADAVKTTSKGTSLVPFNVKNTRIYKTRDGNTGTYVTYFNAIAWSEVASTVESMLPIKDEFSVISGNLKPSSYEKDGENVDKIDIWINDINFVNSSTLSTGSSNDEVPEEDNVSIPSSIEYKDGESEPF